MSKTIDNLEEQFSNICHVIGNDNLSIQILGEDNPKIVERTQNIARAMMNFKKAFVEFRENNYK